MEDIDILQTAGEESESLQLDFGKFLRGFWKRKWLLIVCAILAGVYFYYRTTNQVPVYSTKVTIRTKKFEPGIEGSFDRERQIELRSHSFAERVTARMGLVLQWITNNSREDDVFQEFQTDRDPVAGRYKIKVDDKGQYALCFVEDDREVIIDSCNVWDAVTALRTANGMAFRLRSEFAHASKEIFFNIRPFEWAVNRLKNDVRAAFNRSGDVMVITMYGTDPEELPKRLNRIAEVYVQETENLKNDDRSVSRKVMEEKINNAEQKLNEAESALRTFHERYPLSLDAEKRMVENQLANVRRALRELPQQRTQLTDLLDRLGETVDGTDPEKYHARIVRQLANFAAISSEPVLSLYRDQLREQEQEYNDLAMRVSEDYEPLMELRQKIHQTQDNIISFASEYRNTLAEQENQNRIKLEELQEQQRKFPAEEERLAQLGRNKEIIQKAYFRLWEDYQAFDIRDGVKGEEIEILDRAIGASTPLSSSPKKMGVIGAVVGMIFGMAISLGIDISDRKIRNLTDVEKHLHVPVIGAIPEVNFKNIPKYHDHEKAKQIDKQLVTHDYSPTPIGEAYRALRTQLMFSKDRDRLQTLLVTSVGPEEGKSFTASNLAIIFAQQRTNTLLVDADLRRGVLHNTFSMKKDPGLTNYLSNNATLSTVVQQTHIPNLSIISCGGLIPNPSELLGSLQMKRFLDEVKRKFDLIIFDTPPMDAATDSVVLGSQTDAVALVVMAGKLNRNLVKEKLEIFKTVPAKIVGAILNGSESALVQSYSYYHY